jgi:SulP family sulfate permease
LIPLPVLAGILITVGIGIIDYKGLKHILHVPKADAAVMLIVLTMTVFVDLLQAVAVGITYPTGQYRVFFSYV